MFEDLKIEIKAMRAEALKAKKRAEDAESDLKGFHNGRAAAYANVLKVIAQMEKDIKP